MTRLFNSLLGFAALLAAADVLAQDAAPKPIFPASLEWFSPPGNPLVRGAWMLGGENEAAPYVLRVTLAPGGRLPVHTHNDTRVTTVLSGTLYVGFGERFNSAALIAVPAGAVYVAPAHIPHFLMAVDGEVNYQEAGFGPTATIPFNP